MQLRYSIFGESHGPAIGVVIENLPSGIPVDIEFINSELDRRRAKKGGLSTPRLESDLPEIVSGVFEGFTTGTPLCAIIRNGNTRSGDYSRTKDLARPSHADYTGRIRYGGFNDYRGGGHFSGRLTAPMVFAGAVAKLWLKEKGIFVGGHILRVGEAEDLPFDPVHIVPADFQKIASRTLPTISEEAGKAMEAIIQQARMEQTSVGGIVQCAVTGLPAEIGSPDESLEGIIAKNIFSVPAVKGLEFGLGFGFGSAYGHEVNDPMRMENGRVVSSSNNNGGILGGISSGMPLIFQAAIKPTPSISRPQDTINMETMENSSIEIQGRHDPCILSRATVVIEAAAALSVMEAILDSMTDSATDSTTDSTTDGRS